MGAVPAVTVAGARDHRLGPSRPGHNSVMTPDVPARPASWDVEDAAVRKRKIPWRLIGAAAVVAVLGGLVAWKLVAEEDTAWPASLGVRPAAVGGPADPIASVTPKGGPAVYVWSDFSGFHLWVVPGGDIGAVSGTIKFDDDLAAATLAVPGAGTLTKGSDQVTFELPADRPVVGIDFSPGFYAGRLEIELRDADGPLAPGDVRIGGQAIPAESMPVVIQKVPQDEAADR